jgi:hypothetical protein
MKVRILPGALNGEHMNQDHELRFGYHSNIPKCCVEFFASTLSLWTEKERKAYNKRVDLSVEKFGYSIPGYRAKFYWNYVPCPECCRSGYRQRLMFCMIDHRQKCEFYAYMVNGLSDQEIELLKKGEESIYSSFLKYDPLYADISEVQ